MGEDAVIGAASCAWGVLLTHGKFCEEAGPAGPKSEIQISPSKLFDPSQFTAGYLCVAELRGFKNKMDCELKREPKVFYFCTKKKKKSGAVKCENTSFSN